MTAHSAAAEGRGPSFIPLYHFQPLTNIKTFIWNFACEMTITYFLSYCLYLPDCYSMRFTTLLNYDLINWCDVNFCLFTWFVSRLLLQQLTGKLVDQNSHRLSPLYYKRTDTPSVLVTPIRTDWNLSLQFFVKGCIRYIVASLFCMSKREHLWDKEKCFLFNFESSFRSWDN